MTLAIEPDVHNPESWLDAEYFDVETDLLVCPTCVVVVPAPMAREHIDKKHTVEIGEAVRHGGVSDFLKDFLLKADFAEQIAALHARQYWDHNEVERALGAIYQYQCTGSLGALESTWTTLESAAVEWHSRPR